MRLCLTNKGKWHAVWDKASSAFEYEPRPGEVAIGIRSPIYIDGVAGGTKPYENHFSVASNGSAKSAPDIILSQVACGGASRPFQTQSVDAPLQCVLQCRRRATWCLQTYRSFAKY